MKGRKKAARPCVKCGGPLAKDDESLCQTCGDAYLGEFEGDGRTGDPQRGDADRDVRLFVAHIEATHVAKTDATSWDVPLCVECHQAGPCDALIAARALGMMLDALPPTETLVRVQSQLEDFDWRNR